MKLRKNYWRMGLLLLAALLVPQWLGAQTITSTFVSSYLNYPAGQQGTITTVCVTNEGNDWSAGYDVTVSENGIAFYGRVTLTSLFPVTGELTGITMECNDAIPLLVDVWATDETGGYSSLGQPVHNLYQDGTLLSLDFDDPIWLENANLQLAIDVDREYDYSDSLRIYSINLFFAEDVDDNPLGVGIYKMGGNDDDYYDYIVDITDSNKDDVLGDGTISFDPTNNTLTLNNASFGGTAGAMYCDLPELTIHLIGNNTLTSYEGFIYMWGQANNPTLTFTTDEDNPGMLTFKDAYDEEMLFSGVTPTYLNGLSLNQIDNDFIIARLDTYGLWVGGTEVNSLNKDNVLGDDLASVVYNPSTSTLTLNEASINGSIESLDDLTVYLMGTNSIYSNYDVFQARGNEQPTLTFTTKSTLPGSLLWGMASGALFQHGYNVVYQNGLAQQEGGLIAVEPYAEYSLTVNGTQVNSLNRLDVLGTLNDKGQPTVQFDGKHTLSLNGASITGRILSGLDELTVHLQGENRLINPLYTSQTLMASSTADATLTFTKSMNDPGSLLLVDQSGKKNFIEGFSEEYQFEYDLRMEQNGDNAMMISTFDPLPPIVQEDGSGDTPVLELNLGNFPFSETLLDNVILENVLFTGLTHDNNIPRGVVMTTGVDEADVDAAMLLTPGSDEFANTFKGITFRLPAGTGIIKLTYEAEPGSTLKLRIGNEAPYELTGSDTVEIPYTCLEPTLTFIYLANNSASSRLNGPHRWKGEVGHVKSSSLSVTSSSMVNNNSAMNMQNGVQDMVNVYSLPASALNADGNGIELSMLEMTTQPAGVMSRGHKVEAETVLKPITGLGNDLFDDVEKEKILYINLSESQLKDFALSRFDGPMNGFGKNTLVYLPSDNFDGGEENVVVNGNCVKLQLDETSSFLAPYNFVAKKVVMNREFNPGHTTTLFLPFALTSLQAQAAGSFQTFVKIQDDKAVFRNVAAGSGIEANVPYMFVPGVSSIEFDDMPIKGYKSTTSTGTFIGSFEKLIWAKDQSDVYLFSPVNNRFLLAKAGSVLPSFQAYLKAATSESELRFVVDDGTVVGIETVREAPVADEWFTIDGQRLSSKPTRSGLFIHNGEKVMLR